MNKELRIIFIGTPDFAVESLKQVHESGRNVIAVITAPDKKAGRGQKIQSPAVKKYAEEHNLKILQPTNLKSAQFIEELKELRADIQIVVAFRMLPEVVWNMPPLGTFNLHASLLPNYRGAAPINWAIINGEKETGLTTFFLKHEIDTGDLLLQEKVEITDTETAGSLHDKLMISGGGLVVKSLEKIEEGNLNLTEQEKLIASTDQIKFAPKIFKEDCKIDWSQSNNQIDCFVRGLTPYPTAWTVLEDSNSGKKLKMKIYAIEKIAAPENYSVEIGMIQIMDKKTLVMCGRGVIRLIEVQLEGKKRMNINDLLNGFEITNYKFT